jgi:hypothetical protein
MTIEIQSPELEAIILERMKVGGFSSPEDALIQAFNPRIAPQPRPDSTERDVKHQEALVWLEAHRKDYRGQWLALEGTKLLASGKKASEVFEAVRALQPPPLIVNVEAEDLPFAGW